MNENNINKSVHQKSLKIFFVKLISTSIVIIIVINPTKYKLSIIIKGYNISITILIIDIIIAIIIIKRTTVTLVIISTFISIRPKIKKLLIIIIFYI